MYISNFWVRSNPKHVALSLSARNFWLLRLLAIMQSLHLLYVLTQSTHFSQFHSNMTLLGTPRATCKTHFGIWGCFNFNYWLYCAGAEFLAALNHCSLLISTILWNPKSQFKFTSFAYGNMSVAAVFRCKWQKLC